MKILAVQKVKNEMLKAFEKFDLGEMKFFLGIEISQFSEGISCYKRGMH